MSERLFYINNSWLNYFEAHSLGYTLSKPEILTFYTSNFTSVQVRKDTDDNTFYDGSAFTWYSDITYFSPKLYNRLGEKVLYAGNNKIEFEYSYSDSVYDTTSKFVEYNSTMTRISDLYYNRGMTEYECQIYLVREGEILSWYDSNTDLYWDNRPGHFEWTSTPPEEHVEAEQQDVSIVQSMCDIEFWDLFDENNLPEYYSPRAFSEQLDYLSTQKPMLVGFQLVDFIEPTYDTMYTDSVEYDITFYVAPEDGITTEWDGVYHPQGDTFTGDIQTVYVEAEDTAFWLGSERFIFGKTFDDTHQIDVNPLYWCSTVYLTYSDLHDAGYTLTESKDIDVWDINSASTRTIVAYTQSGTESECSCLSTTYRINSLGNNFYTEDELASLGWYIKWRLYTITENTNIYNNYENGDVVSQVYSGMNVPGNPYTIVSNQYGDWQEVKYFDSVSGNVNTGYINVSNISYTLGIVADNVIVNSITVALGLKRSNNSWDSTSFSSSDYWHSGILSLEDKSLLTTFGLTIIEDSNYPYGLVGYNPSLFGYAPIGLYSDINATIQNEAQISNFYASSDTNSLRIYSRDSYSTLSMTWKCIIQRLRTGSFLDLLMGFRYGKDSSPESWSGSSTSYTSILSEEDRTRVYLFGLTTYDNDYQYGEIVANNNNYSFTPLALYSDLSGTQLITDDMSNFECRHSNSYYTLQIVNNGSSLSTPAYTWKLRITKIS